MVAARQVLADSFNHFLQRARNMHKASNDLRRARQISDLVKNQLSHVAAALPSIPANVAATGLLVDTEAAEAVRAGTAGQVPVRPGARCRVRAAADV